LTPLYREIAMSDVVAFAFILLSFAAFGALVTALGRV
jgi:hypothetical protein